MRKFIPILLVVLMLFTFCSCTRQHDNFNKYLAGRELYITAQFNNMGESVNEKENELFVDELNRHLAMPESDSLKLYETYHKLIDTVPKGTTINAVDKYHNMLSEMIGQCVDKTTQIKILKSYHLKETDIDSVLSEYALDLFGQQLISEAYFAKYKDLSPDDESMNFWNKYSMFEKEMIEQYNS